MTPFITIGLLFLLGLLTDVLGRHTPLPRVTLLLLFGFAIGPGGLDVLPDLDEAWFDAVTKIALVMVGFLMGGSLELASLRRYGRGVLGLSLAVVLATVVALGSGLWLLGAEPALALLLAAIACATDPAASTDVIHERHADGPFTRTLLGIVAIDDAWGLIVFSLLAAIAQGLAGNGGSGSELLVEALWEIWGAVGLGLVLGVPMAYLTGRIQPGEPILAEALGMVFLCAGLAIWLEVSYLLAALVMGMAVVNLAKHHRRPFGAIEGIEWPFLVLFFALSGAAFELGSLAAAGLLGLGYILLRVLGRVLGALLGGRLADFPSGLRIWMGLALLPQAGVALGMALVAGERFPALRDALLSMVIAATVIFELLGPIVSRLALERSGEAGAARPGTEDRDSDTDVEYWG